MGHRLQHLTQGPPKPHHLSNAAHVKKLLIWSSAIVLPFLVLVCIFPSGASDLYKPSLNRIVVSQYQIPRIQSGGVIQSKLSSDDALRHDDNPPIEASVGDGADANLLVSKDVQKQSNPLSTEEEIAEVGMADSQPKAAIIPEETAAPSITEVDNLSSSSVRKQDGETISKKSLNDLSSSESKKQGDGGKEKKHNDGQDNNLLPKKATKEIDEDDESATSEVKQQNHAEEMVAPSINYVDTSKRTKTQALRDGDESDSPALMVEAEIDGQIGDPNSESKKKKENGQLNAEGENKKNTKMGKIIQFSAEEKPEIELNLELEPNLAEVESKKRTKKAKTMHNTDVEEDSMSSKDKKSLKKAKAMHDMDETDGNVEYSMSRQSTGHQEDEGSFTAKSSKKTDANEVEEDNFSILGKESSLEGDPTSFRSTSSNQSSRKAMGMSYNDKKDDEEDDAEEEVSFPGKSFAKKGKSSDDDGDHDGEGSSADAHFSDFLLRADEEALLSEPKKKKKKVPSGIDLDDNPPDFDEVDLREWKGRRKISKKKNKEAPAEEDLSIFKQKHDDEEEAFNTSLGKSDAKRTPSSLEDDDSDEFSLDLPRKKRIGSRKVGNNDLDIEIDNNEEASIDDFMDSLDVNKKLTQEMSLSSGDCKYFKGRWVMDSNGPPYLDSTCPWKSINDDEQTCKTARESSYWRWQPSECNMKHFRAVAFLKLMEGKAMAFVGDKMVKVQMKSLVCLLAEVEAPTLLYNDKSNQSMSWHFSSSNMTISLIWSPYLVQYKNEGQYSQLWLDKLDTKWATMVPTLDVLVLGVGANFARPTLYRVKNSVVGCYSCQSLSSNVNITNLKEISLYSGFRASMRSSIMGIGALAGFEGTVLFLQPFGFEGNGSYFSVSSKMKEIQDEELKKAQSRGSIANQSKMVVLHTNLNSVSNYDPIRGLTKPSCLIPSPLADTWNQVLQHTLTRVFTLE